MTTSKPVIVIGQGFMYRPLRPVRRAEHCPWPRRVRVRHAKLYESWDCERGEHRQCGEKDCRCDCHIDKHYGSLGAGVVIPAKADEHKTPSRRQRRRRRNQ